MTSVSRRRKAAEAAPEDPTLRRNFERKVRLSRLALFAERVWEALFWPFMVAAAFLIVTLLGLWPLTPPLLHRILLAAFGLCLLASLLPLFRIALPGRLEALRRLERDAGIKHRPASSYEDKLGATPPRETAQLWAAHRARLARLIARLKPAWPRPRTDRHDPYALRALALLGLVAAFLAAGGDSWTRLRQAFSPAASATPTLIRLDAWLTPPVYTATAPIVLADGTETVGAGAETFRALSVPERSVLVVRAHAPQGESVTLTTANEDGSKAAAVDPKTKSKEGLIEFQTTLTQSGSADVKIGGQTVAKWRFALIKDELPTIALMGNPGTTPRQALRLVFRADDDHGVASAEARFALVNPDGSAAPVQTADPVKGASPSGAEIKPDPLSQPPVMTLQLPRANAKKIEGKATQDLTSHPWAGLPVRMTLFAKDQAGQTGQSPPYDFILPERQFTKPLARALIEQRKKLVRNDGTTEQVARALDALTLGADKVVPDQFVYMMIRNAYWRLRSDQSRGSVASVVGQLWDIALRIEDGDLPEAERNLRSAQDALQKALRENASSEEIKQLVDELRQALSQYLQTLAQQQQEKGNQPQQPQPNGDEMLSQQDLEKMLKNIEDLAKAGSKDLAEKMLSELKDMLDRIQTGNMAETPDQQRARQAMKDMNQMISEQQKLLDDTFAARREQQRQSGGGGQQGDQFEVSPPGSPMDLGQSEMPFFDLPGETPQGGLKGQGDSGRSSKPQRSQLEIGRQPGQMGQGKHGPLGERQDQLREKLQAMIDRFRMQGGKAPEPMEGARDAMGEAKDAIQEDNLDRATQQQSLALDRLRQGAQDMAEQMQQGGEMQAGQGPGNNGRDPLGRPDRSNRPDLGLSVKVPDQIDIQRAREVLDEIRQRLGDPSRPTFELDYLERLIRSF
jgi:uncharacterized protein (TIGR02302 family)